jgi:hypothetical protein
MNTSYPEGNFGWNQLLEISVDLSSLCSSLKIDLHVRTFTTLHQSFLWLRSAQAKINLFRVPTCTLYLRSTDNADGAGL